MNIRIIFTEEELDFFKNNIGIGVSENDIPVRKRKFLRILHQAGLLHKTTKDSGNLRPNRVVYYRTKLGDLVDDIIRKDKSLNNGLIFDIEIPRKNLKQVQ